MVFFPVFFFFYIIISCSFSAASRSTVRNNQTQVLACKNLWIGQCMYVLTVGEDIGGHMPPSLFYFSFIITNFAMLLSFFFFFVQLAPLILQLIMMKKNYVPRRK